MPTLLDACELRAATRHDVETLVQISTGHIADKRAFITASLMQRDVVVAVLGGKPVGYVIWDRAFFGRPFIWLLGVDPALRRRGIATSLLAAFEGACRSESLFTSTNESNATMHAVLARCGYVRSGSVENLDPGDPEIFYFKAGVR